MDKSHHLIRTMHSTCMVNDYDHTIAALTRVVGLRVLEYGELETIGRRGGMTWVGDNSLEVAQPIVKDHAAQRFLDRFGPGMHSYALQVANLDGTLSHLNEEGVTVGARPGPGFNFCFTDPRTTGGLLFEWSEFTVDQDPRVGTPLPPMTVEPLLDIRTHAFVGAVVPDPLTWARTFGPILGFPEAFRHPDARPGQPVVGLVVPDCVLALYPLPDNSSKDLWGASHPRSRWHVLGLEVPDLDEAVAILSTNRVGIVRRYEDQVVVDPTDTGDVPVILVEELLPGDPRWADRLRPSPD
jgi:hypothetical protein